MKLHTRYRNSAGQRVRIVLNLKGVEYEYVPIEDWQDPAYREINPQGLMPALEVGGRVFGQSTAIIEWLEETYPDPSILPADPLDRIASRGFAQYIACEIHPVHNHRVRDHLMDAEGWTEEKTMVWYEHWVTSGLRTLETMLSRRTTPTSFCYDEKPTMADIYLIPVLYNARHFNFDLTAFPRLLEVENACRGLPAFQAAAPENQPDYPAQAG